MAYLIRHDWPSQASYGVPDTPLGFNGFQVNPDGVAISEYGNELHLLLASGSIYWRSDNFGGKGAADRRDLGRGGPPSWKIHKKSQKNAVVMKSCP